MTRIIVPILNGDPIRRGDPFLMGGSLIALWKKEGGVRPILIGDADRRLATKVLMASLQRTMAKHLLKAHPRVAQFSVHVEDGTTKAVHCV